jgi:hypothetical protein
MLFEAIGRLAKERFMTLKHSVIFLGIASYFEVTTW